MSHKPAAVKTEAFQVRVSGIGFRMQAADGALSVGFFATRVVRAFSADAARTAALQEVENDLLARDVQRSGAASMKAESVSEIGWFRALWWRPTGFTFYEE